MCGLDPHPGQGVGGCCRWAGSCCLCCWMARTADRLSSCIARHCFFAASCALHIAMAASRVSSCCRSKCSTVSLSFSPSIIWSLMFLCAHWSEQKLHVFVSSLRATKKSSKLSPVCCLRLLKLRRSTDSLTWPSMWRLIARMIASTSFLCSSDRPRLLTIARVSLDKHKVNTCTLVSAPSSASPDRVQ